MPEGSHSAPHDAPMGEEESHRLSMASISSTTPSDGSDVPSSGSRPASLITLMCSGSESSHNDNLAPPLPLSQTSDTVMYIDLDLDPSQSEQTNPHTDDANRKGHDLELWQNNNNNKLCTAAQTNTCRQQTQASSFVGGTTESNPRLTYLDRVVMEIIETEQLYVRDLRMIVEDYLAHIIDHSDLSLRPEQVCALFGNIEDIYEFNSELLQCLELCNHDPVAIARCFVKKSEYFDIYTQYCTNYPNSVAALTECMRNKSLAKFFRERQASLNCSLPLGSYLLKPVQRILKYHLLLQEIVKHFDPDEQGYEVVEEAIYTMTGVAWYINDMKRKHEHAVRLQEIQSLLLSWKGADLTTYGELVLEGTFKVHRAKKERTLFLFERILLITKRRSEHFIYKTHITCSTLMLIESSKDSLSFSVTHYKHPKQSHTVQAKTVEEKKLWTHHIKRLILENHHAIIPQKAKEAILEMNSTFSRRFHYSPERLNKALSCQSEFSHDERPATQQSATLKDVDGGDVLEKESSVSVDQETNEQIPTDHLQEETSLDKPTNPEAEVASETLEASETLKVEAETDEHLNASPESDSKTFSKSEDEEGENEDEGADTEVKDGRNTSILPSSVLNVMSPRLLSSLRLRAEPSDRSSLLNRSWSIPSAFGETDLTLLSPRGISVFDGERGTPQRRDSTLSKQDLVLIGKIKTYYENAENQDASFSIRRRESLSYIPNGLVRNSVSRINNIPKDKTPPVEKNPLESDQTLSSSPSAVEPDSCSGGHMASSASLDSDSAETDDSGFGSRSQSMQDKPAEGEEFRSSSDMIKIWLAMERDILTSQRNVRVQQRCHEIPRNHKTANAGLSNLSKSLNKSSDKESAEMDLSTIVEESTCSLPLKAPELKKITLKGATKVFGEEGVQALTPGPRVAQLKAEAEPHGATLNQLDETDKAKSKVLHLARQYSQRIKTSKPATQQPDMDLINKMTLPSMEEEMEEEDSGKPGLTLPLVSAPLRPMEQICSPSSPHTCICRDTPGPMPLSRPQTLSPLSPLSPPPAEEFYWPDVQELCSKYADTHTEFQKSSICRRWSSPNQTLESKLRRHSSCSPGLVHTQGVSSEFPSANRHNGCDAEIHKQLQSAKSHEPQLSGTLPDQLQELQEGAKGYYITAEASLPNDPQHKIIIMENLPEPQSARTAQEDTGEGGDSYVQIRSPTSREKISIIAVMERCRAYQDSEDYKQRDHVKSRTEPEETDVPFNPMDCLTQKTKEPTEIGQQSLVKNLREKFQTFQ
ncbi:pleckstrin homology domain-containing family G member 3-like isoform X2 [Genypterus blacodes]|uniref:pleckstrin homology domain-containing family G member 3-like isoform X2 n=1 Tax=Genypterus blacodes TaxID=154954 RepID=UPI003F769C76